MTEHKFTDEEVIAHMLAYCGRICGKCEVKSICCDTCVILRIRDGVDLINRQKAEIAFWQDAAANARREILLEIERLALSKIPKDVNVEMLKDTYYIEAIDELMIKYGVTDKTIGCKIEEEKE